MSNSREIINLGAMPCYEPYYEFQIKTFVLTVGRLVLEAVEPTGPKIHIAPNHQDYIPNHRNNGRSKFKRSGR